MKNRSFLGTCVLRSADKMIADQKLNYWDDSFSFLFWKMHAYISSLTLMLYISPWEAHRRYILRPGPEQNCYLRSEMQFQILKFPIISFLQPRGSPRPCRITSEQKSRLPQAHFKKPTDWFRHERETKMGRDITWNRKYLRWGEEACDISSFQK